MGVSNVHRTYNKFARQWRRARDTFAGSDAVKDATTAYLPMLEGHSILSNAASAYDAYKMRALFYPAIARTVTGLVGLVFGKPPTSEGVPIALEKMFDDVTLTGVSLSAYALQLCRESLLVGRAGTFVDVPEVSTIGARPYAAMYDAESIVNWKTERINGKRTLTLLVLKEEYETTGDDEFTPKVQTQYRVLRLTNDIYTVSVYRESTEKSGEFIAGAERVPVMRGSPLNFIPFVFLGPVNTEPDIDHPPLQDLIDVNLSHYRTSADQEHGAHFVALPTPVITGHTLEPGELLKLGPGNALMLKAGATATMLEFSGSGMAALKDLKEEKRQLMATLGARMLETQKNTQEAAQTVRLRHAGERSALAVLADVLGQHLTQVVRWHLYWSGVNETVVDKVLVKMNPDTLDELSSEEVTKLISLWQAGLIAKRTVYYNIQWGEWTRPDVTFEEEEAEIKKEAASGTPNLNMPPGNVPPQAPSGTPPAAQAA